MDQKYRSNLQFYLYIFKSTSNLIGRLIKKLFKTSLKKHDILRTILNVKYQYRYFTNPMYENGNKRIKTTKTYKLILLLLLF